MRIITIILLLLVTLAFVFADEKIDSLQIKLNSSSDKDKTAILNKLAEEYSPVSPKKAIDYANEALKLAEKFKQTKEISNSYKNLADCYYYLYKIPESIEMYKKSAEIEKQIYGETSENYEKSLGDIGYCYEMLLKFNDAISVYQEALNIARKLDIKEEIIILLNNIGQANFKLAKYDKALEYFNKTLKTEQQFGNLGNLSITYNNIGRIYDSWKQYEKAIEYYKQALEIDKQYKNEARQAIRMNNIGYSYRALEQYDEALKYLINALKIEKKYKRFNKIAIRQINIGQTYSAIEEFGKALESFESALKLCKKMNMIKETAIIYNNQGHVYTMLGEYKKAETFLNKCKIIVNEKKLKQQQIFNLNEFAILYQKMGNYARAYQNQVAYSKLKDEIFTEEKLKQLSEFEARFETVEKEKKIELLTKNREIQDLKLKENRIVKYSFIAGFMIVLALSFIIYGAYKREQIEIEKRKIAEKELSDLNKNLEHKVEEEVQIRREQEQKAVEQSRLAVLGELAAGIAHEINQPLHSIAFAIDNMSMAIEEDDADKEYLQKKIKNIFGDVDRMKRIIDHIRTFSRKQAGVERELFNINQSITNAVNMISEQYANHRIKLDVELDANLPKTLGNLYRFEQVVLILFSNGKDAVEEKAKNADEEYQKSLSIKTFKKDQHIYLEFEDNGTGIPKENLDKIFNPFYTTKKPGEGTGLGLYIAFEIIGDMEGKIDIVSEVGKGTKTMVELTANSIE